MNNSIRDYLINIYDKLSHKSTLLNGIALFKYLIKKEFYVNDKCNYIIKELTEQTNKLSGEDKKECLILLPYFFINQISLKYLTKILNILFSQINHTTEPIFNSMSKIYADILVNIQALNNPNDYINIIKQSNGNINYNNIEDNIKYINILLRLCLDLIDNNNINCLFKSKYHDFSLENYQQKCGFLFLGQFIEHYKDLTNDNRLLNTIINVLKNNFYNLKNKNFTAKKELLTCFNILINKLKQGFNIYAKDLLNNIYLFDKTLLYSPSSNKSKNNDFIDLKKYFLDIIYSLLLYNKQELIDDYKKILTYAKINKSSPNKEIRSISIKIIDLIIKDNYENALNLDLDNYASNCTKGNTLSKTIKKERALSFKNRESQIKKMINEDKKRYGDKKQNKNFIFVSQKSVYDSLDGNDEPANENFYSEKKSQKKNFENSKNQEKNEKNNGNINNLNVVSLKINEIKNMNDNMIQAVNNIENYLTNNFNTMEIKLNRIDKYEENYRNRNKKFMRRTYYSKDKKNILDEKIKNIILNDEKLVDFIEEISEKDINNISIQYYEQILNRLMILNLINKNIPSQVKKYTGLIQKLLDSKKIYNNNNNDYTNLTKTKKDNYQKYKISYNLENNLDYLFNSLNN
jgi:hypothetical protein